MLMLYACRRKDGLQDTFLKAAIGARIMMRASLSDVLVRNNALMDR